MNEHWFYSEFQELAAMETLADKMLPCGDGDEDVLPNKRLLR